jgi:hypothetical protein
MFSLRSPQNFYAAKFMPVIDTGGWGRHNDGHHDRVSFCDRVRRTTSVA